jgi:hypothetical protein
MLEITVEETTVVDPGELILKNEAGRIPPSMLKETEQFRRLHGLVI